MNILRDGDDMKTINLYLSGGMTNLSYKERTTWRNQIKNSLKYEDYDCDKRCCVFDPTIYFDIDNPTHQSEKEAMNFDLNALRKSDLIVVNFNDEKSIGTAMEIMLAYELRIPIIGICTEEKVIHPWLLQCVDRMCRNTRECVNYIIEYYLN